MAEHHDAKALRILGGRIFEVIAPDLAEKFDGKALEAEEARALRRTTFTMFEDDEGTCHGRFRIPALHGQMLTKMILAISLTVSVHQRQRRLVGQRHRPRPAHPGPPRHRADPADRDLPRREAPEDRRLLRHRRGHHDPRTTHRRPRPRRGLHPGHRRPDHRGRSPPTRVHRRDHPRRPRREEPGPRRRPQTTTAQRNDADRHGCARRRLHRAGLRNTTRPLPRPPQHPVVPRRTAPASKTAASSAPTTTAASTTPTTRPDSYPAARSASTGGPRHTGRHPEMSGARYRAPTRPVTLVRTSGWLLVVTLAARSVHTHCSTRARRGELHLRCVDGRRTSRFNESVRWRRFGSGLMAGGVVAPMDHRDRRSSPVSDPARLDGECIQRPRLPRRQLPFSAVEHQTDAHERMSARMRRPRA